MNPALPAALAAIILVGIAGCASSSSPTVSGFGIGTTRVVSVGDEVVVTLPATGTGLSEWKLSSFDSVMLRLTQRPRLDVSADGERRVWVARFVTRVPGETEVVFTRTGVGEAGGPVGERQRFKIRILG